MEEAKAMTPFQEEVYEALVQLMIPQQYATAPGSYSDCNMIQFKLNRSSDHRVSNKHIHLACQKLKEMGLILEFDNCSVGYKVHSRLFRIAYPTDIVQWKQKKLQNLK